MAALTRGLRRALVIVFLAFAAVGSYYAWTGPEGASSAERAPLMVVEAPEVREPRREASTQTPTNREEASIAAPAPSIPAPAPSAIDPVAAEPTPVVVVVEPVLEDVIEILPLRAAAEFESEEVDSEPVDASSGDSSSGDPTSETGVRRHRVESGETLSSIAARYYGDASEWRRVAAANPGLDADRLAIGMVILVPTDEVPVATPAVAPESPAPGRTHVVAEGETLSSIAAAVYGDSSQWRRLYEANRSVIGADPGAIRVGMRLVVPAR